MEKSIKDYTEFFATYQRIRDSKEQQDFVVLGPERKGKGEPDEKRDKQCDGTTG